ncbi:hypothetical protein FVER53590_08589 [Fusarium verticillioides]|nr:hypothetical protein FVER53590_08589 [Fusarium verticillioides]
MGKGGLYKAISQFAGAHSGAGTLSTVKEALESVDMVIWIGNYSSDFNTGEFTTVLDKDAIVIDLQHFSVSVAFGLCDTKLPSGVMMFSQTVYGSIEYATGAIVGVGQAIKESGVKWKRPVLITGEGSMHLTIQTLADMLRWDLKPIIFVLNNGGYTVERLIHGKEAFFDEVAVLEYSMLGKTFSNQLSDPIGRIVLPPLDAPSAVFKTGAAIDAFNKAKAEQRPSGIQGA